jgi:hypothetical protein
MRWMMDAMDRVKMSKEPKPILRPAVTTDGQIILLYFILFLIDLSF